MESLLMSYILPIFGLLILLFCILSYIFPYGEKFKEKIQKIKAFGLNIEVSVLTLFIIIGLVFSCLGIYFYVNRYTAQISKYETQINKLNTKLVEAEEKDIVLIVSLDGVSEENEPSLTDLQCHYRCPVLDQEVRADVSKGYLPAQYKIHLRDIKRTTYIVRLTIEDASNGKKWVKENFAPFEPYYELNREN
jgi:hypothetical protein